jgi:hypothetical protein
MSQEEDKPQGKEIGRFFPLFLIPQNEKKKSIPNE